MIPGFAALVAALALVFTPAPARGQGKQISSQTAQPGSTQDFSSAAITRPMRIGTTTPATCRIGDQFYKTNASAGSNLYGCTATNTWTVQAGGGGGSGTVTSIATTTPITGGTITGTGTIACATCVTSAAALTSTALMTGAALQASQTPSATSTLDSSGNMALAGTLASTGVSTGTSPPTCAVGTAGTLCLKEGTAPTGEAAVAEIYSKTDHLLYTKLNNGAETAMVVAGGALGTPSSGTGTNITGIPNNNVLATSLPAAGTSTTLVGPRQYYVCSSTCTITVPVPVAGYEFCVMNDDNVATAITLSALGSSARYENSARTAYGTAGTGTLVVSAAAANKICLVGLDSTHYLTVAYNGTVTVN